MLSLGPGEGFVKFLTEKHSPMPNGGLGWVVFSKVSYTWWFGALCLGSDTGSTGASPMLLLLYLTWYMGIMAVMTLCRQKYQD